SISISYFKTQLFETQCANKAACPHHYFGTGESGMPLHDKDSVRDMLDDDVYGSIDFAGSVPKYKFPGDEHDPRRVYSLVHDELMLVGNSRQNLATFCQTWAEPEVHKLMDECMDKNMIDKDEYPQTAENDLADRLRCRGWQVPAYSLPANRQDLVI